MTEIAVEVHPMRIFTLVVATVLALSGLCLSAKAAAPSAPTYTTPGTYTVSWGSPNPYGGGPLIMEKQGIHGEYVLLEDPNEDGVVQVTRPEGEYVYMGVDWWLASSDGWYYWEAIPSDETLTVVSSGATPSQNPMSTQLQYSYVVRYGDINGDGLTDLYLNRASGGTAGDGAIVKLILTQRANQRFSAIVPNSSQISTASSWPAASVQVQLEDFNLDGFVDTVLKGVAGIVSGAHDQIVFAPGKLFAGAPQAVTAIDETVQSFVADFDRWSRNPSYFDQNAPIVSTPVFGWDYWCYPWIYPGYGDYGGYYEFQCFYYPVIVGYIPSRDYSMFDQSAIALSGGFTTVSNGVLTPEVVPGSDPARILHDVFRRIFGVDILRGVLRNGCNGGVLAYDADTTINCSNTATIGQVLLMNLQQFTTERGQCRPPTNGEVAIEQGEGLFVNDVFSIRLCNRTLWYIPIGVNYWVTTPNAIWIGSGWSEDYAVAGQFDVASLLLHEFVHSFQYRNQRVSLVGMLVRKLAAFATGGYVYVPLTGTETFSQFNIEQQAEMVQDRYRLACRPSSGTYQEANQSATLAQLNNVVPFTPNSYRNCIP